MQTEAPRLEGGYGYPELRLRPDVVGTEDGLAKHVYVREARRIRAELTILEQHIGVEARHPSVGAEPFPDSDRHRQLPYRSSPEHGLAELC